MKEPVDHVLRPSLPWRSEEGAITECGLDAAKVKTLTREELGARLKDYGQQRTALTTCMTCVQTAQRWTDWQRDPREAIEREIQWEKRGRWSSEDHGNRLWFELKAVAALIDAHRDEFDALVSKKEGLAAWLSQKAEHSKRQTTKRRAW